MKVMVTVSVSKGRDTSLSQKIIWGSSTKIKMVMGGTH